MSESRCCGLQIPHDKCATCNICDNKNPNGLFYSNTDPMLVICSEECAIRAEQNSLSKMNIKVEVSDIKVMNHCKAPCWYCGYKFERCSGGLAAMYCPSCGCPKDKPLNVKNDHETKNIL